MSWHLAVFLVKDQNWVIAPIFVWIQIFNSNMLNPKYKIIIRQLTIKEINYSTIVHENCLKNFQVIAQIKEIPLFSSPCLKAMDAIVITLRLLSLAFFQTSYLKFLDQLEWNLAWSFLRVSCTNWSFKIFDTLKNMAVVTENRA